MKRIPIPRKRVKPRRVKGVTKTLQKDSPPVDIEYRNFVRQSGCALPRLSPKPHRCWGVIEFSHFPKTRRYGQTGIGLCTLAHQLYHSQGRTSFQQVWEIDLDAEVHRLAHQFIAKYGRVPCV